MVGIFGNKTARNDTSKTNAEIGLTHEYGSISDNIPVRSFLRMPLSEKSKELVAFASSEKKKIEHQMSKGNIRNLFVLLGIKAEAIIQEAFETGGFGKWLPKKPREDGKNSPLIVEGELRRSISSKVGKHG